MNFNEFCESAGAAKTVIILIFVKLFLIVLTLSFVSLSDVVQSAGIMSFTEGCKALATFMFSLLA